jgi:hypothetical protein
MTVLENGDQVVLASDNITINVDYQGLGEGYTLELIPLSKEGKNTAGCPYVLLDGVEGSVRSDDVPNLRTADVDLFLSDISADTVLIKVVFGAEAPSEDTLPLSALGRFEVTIGHSGEVGERDKVNGFHDFYGKSLRIGNFIRVEGEAGPHWVFEAQAGCSENSIQDLLSQHGV